MVVRHRRVRIFRAPYLTALVVKGRTAKGFDLWIVFGAFFDKRC